MSDRVVIEAINFEAVQNAMILAPQKSFVYVKEEMIRFGKRFRKKFIRERMSGPPGITWRTARMKIGGNVKASVSGTDLSALTFETKISRFLRRHEEGALIRPRRGAWLYIIRRSGAWRSGKGKREVLARVSSVRIPARLGFVHMAEREVKSDLVPRIHKGIERALQVTFEQKFKSIGRLVGRLAA